MRLSWIDKPFWYLNNRKTIKSRSLELLIEKKAEGFTNDAKSPAGYYFVGLDEFCEYCNLHGMFHNSESGKVLFSIEERIEMLTSGTQISVRHLDSAKTFANCQYEYDDVQTIFYTDQNLNEIYSVFFVGIYIEIE